MTLNQVIKRHYGAMWITDNNGNRKFISQDFVYVQKTDDGFIKSSDRPNGKYWCFYSPDAASDFIKRNTA